MGGGVVLDEVVVVEGAENDCCVGIELFDLLGVGGAADKGGYFVGGVEKEFEEVGSDLLGCQYLLLFVMLMGTWIEA